MSGDSGGKPSGGDHYRVIGKGIRAARERRGLTLEHVANHAEITHEKLGAIETGNDDYSIQVLERIADALDLSVVRLIGFAYGLGAAGD